MNFLKPHAINIIKATPVLFLLLSCADNISGERYSNEIKTIKYKDLTTDGFKVVTPERAKEIIATKPAPACPGSTTTNAVKASTPSGCQCPQAPANYKVLYSSCAMGCSGKCKVRGWDGITRVRSCKTYHPWIGDSKCECPGTWLSDIEEDCDRKLKCQGTCLYENQIIDDNPWHIEKPCEQP